jgi:hypothetical protein
MTSIDISQAFHDGADELAASSWGVAGRLTDNASMPSDLLRCAALIEGLRLDGPLEVGALVFEPVPIESGFAGHELRQMFNDLLATHGFVSAFERSGWAMQLATRRRLAFVTTPSVEVDQVAHASIQATEELGRVIDALALTHGGAPRLFAAANEFSSDGGESWRTLALLAGSGTYPGTVLQRLLPDGDSLTEIDPREIWTTARSSPLTSLWLSLYRGVAAASRWDVRVLRACSLLEAIGRERLDRDATILDESGSVLLDNGGNPATTRGLRGKLYVLVSDTIGIAVSSPRVFLTSDRRSLWEEIGVWADIRNLVAHEGQWFPPPFASTLAGPQRRSAAALEAAGRGDGYEAGAGHYSGAVLAATEAVLRFLVIRETATTPEDAPPTSS